MACWLQWVAIVCADSFIHAVAFTLSFTCNYTVSREVSVSGASRHSFGLTVVVLCFMVILPSFALPGFCSLLPVTQSPSMHATGDASLSTC